MSRWRIPTPSPRRWNARPSSVDGRMYLTTVSGKVAALDAATGRQIWIHDAYPAGTRNAPTAYYFGLSRGVSVWSGQIDGHAQRRVVFGTTDGRLVSLDAETGKPDSRFGNAGTLDLRSGLGPQSRCGIRHVIPAGIFGDIVVIGVMVGDSNHTNKTSPGDVRAFDVHSGKEVWRFHTVPQPGEVGHETWAGDAWKNRDGANAWGGITVDDKRGMVFVGLGAVGHDYTGADRPGDNLFANSIVALDARTGQRRWHHQLVHHDLWDYDAAAPPTLATALRDGKVVDAVVQVIKTGYMYVFDRDTGKPLFDIVERAVPTDTESPERSLRKLSRFRWRRRRWRARDSRCRM